MLAGVELCPRMSGHWSLLFLHMCVSFDSTHTIDSTCMPHVCAGLVRVSQRGSGEPVSAEPGQERAGRRVPGAQQWEGVESIRAGRDTVIWSGFGVLRGSALMYVTDWKQLDVWKKDRHPVATHARCDLFKQGRSSQSALLK